MLEQVLDFIHNYFDDSQPRFTGNFYVQDGEIRSDDVNMDIKDGQYFRIIGSVFNDGVWKNGDDDNFSSMQDEAFRGEVRLMAIPPAVIKISNEISDWMDKHGEEVSSPYSSESFGGYSYTKAQGDGSGSKSVLSWQSMFASRLNAWRKIS